MRRACVLLVTLAGCQMSSGGASPARVRPTAPADAGAGAAAELDAYLRRAEAAGFSGAVLVAIHGRVVLARGYGWADAGRHVRNRADTRFLVASIAKTFTAAAVARLKARGKLDWDDSIARYLPGVPADKRDITVAQLLGHTSGLPNEYLGEAATDREAAERAILAVPLASPPGTTWRYSNDGYALLTAIVERLTGEHYEDHVRRELIDPVGMRSTGFVWQASQPPGQVARGHNRERITDPLTLRRGWGQRGVGGLISTVEDLHRWAAALDDGRPVSRTVQAEMAAAARPVPRNPGLADGLGWFVVTTARGTRALYHGGNESPAGFTAELRRYVDEGVITVLTCNIMEGEVGLNRKVSPCIEAILFGGRCDWPLPGTDRSGHRMAADRR